MNCPACNKEMVVLEWQHIELDFCLACEGCWLDAGELGLILTGRADLPEDWDIASRKKSRRKCPRCTAKMKAGKLPGTDVEVDVCGKQHGLWLDKGELEAVVKTRGREGQAQPLVEFVESVFHHQRTQ